MDDEVEKIWKEFWVPLVKKNDKIDMEQIKKELFDFRVVMQEVSKVYYEITNGKFSKPNTKAEYIIEATEDYYENLYNNS